MALKQIPFSLEMVKKIQAGEIKGTIRTGDGRAARFICEIRNDKYPLLFICSNERIEWAHHYTIDGCFYYLTGEYAEYNLILEIEDEQKKPEYQFKPFDKVLVRDRDNLPWMPEFFSRYTGLSICKYRCMVNVYIQCIPYEGNEHLLGTNNKPKEE